MELLKNKRVGKVIMIAEGAKHEFNLIKKVFVDVLGFTQIEKRRGETEYYTRAGDRHSVVAVINTKTSNISSINEKEYLEIIFTELIEEYIEAYEISNFVDSSFDLRVHLGSEAKEYINKNAKKISMNKIGGESVIHAGLEMQHYLEESGIVIDLDDFSETNKAEFENEEQCLKESCTFRVLSMLSCVLMDLGILKEQL